MGLILEKALGLVSIQGAPKPGRRGWGVPIGGAVDLDALNIANVALGNEPCQPCFELGLARAEFVASRSGAVAIVGADASVRIGERLLRTNSTMSIAAGERLVVEPPVSGAYVYVAFGDHSTAERRLDRGVLRDRIRYVPSESSTLVPTTRFSVSHQSNRMGTRLAPVIDSHEVENPSEPMTVGAIQWTPSGQLIVIGPDGPTIGGYPTLGVVSSCDLGAIFQRAPLEAVVFEPVTVERARAIDEDHRASMDRKISHLRLYGLR